MIVYADAAEWNELLPAAGEVLAVISFPNFGLDHIECSAGPNRSPNVVLKPVLAHLVVGWPSIAAQVALAGAAQAVFDLRRNRLGHRHTGASGSA